MKKTDSPCPHCEGKDAKIKAALLGDVAAAAECTAAGIAIPCPFCGEARGVT